MNNKKTSNHIVAIFGGAVSGAEAAFQLSRKGIKTIVFEQNALPYGKIEDGLPKWHHKLRDKEEGKIDEKLDHPMVTFVPGVQLGKDIDFEEVVNNWGFSAVFLAIGAWRDRPLPIKDIEQYIEKGLIYQNAFIHWFNHKHEPDYKGEQLDLEDGAVIIGGGLASLDVAKIFMFESVQKALERRGYKVNLFQLDRSIAKVLSQLGYTLEELGINPCTIYYRRRIQDMPLYPETGEKDTPEKIAKKQKIQAKIFSNYQKKYLFNMEPLHSPVDKITENGRLTGLVFQKTKIENGRVVSIPNALVEVKAPMFVSSIGSLPVKIKGIPSEWETYQIDEKDHCKVLGFDHVFAIGNTVTGRGNINTSLRHGRDMTQEVIDSYLANPHETAVSAFVGDNKNWIGEEVASIAESIRNLPEPSEETLNIIGEKIKTFHKKADYIDNYREWAQKHVPVRLEDMVDV
ncbi:MAG: FAD-dependent oxidoreductase [Bacteroidetes bacterium]|nr:FAD-dependent oxidoreductase [Bacteroidota bacterium]